MQKNRQTEFPLLDEGGRYPKKITVSHYWCGGVRGAETDWNNPLNWYNRGVPGWFDEVVISGKHTLGGCFPYIEAFANDVAQLIVEEGGSLFIGEQGRLSVDGLGRREVGILNDGEIYIQGELTVQRTLQASVRNKGLIYNTGSLTLDKPAKRGILRVKPGSFVNFGELLFL